MELARRFMALVANANRSKNQAPFRPEDFYKLSYDTVLRQEADPDLYNRVARKLGSRIRGKDEQ